jgi:hypothetical protein
MVCLLACGGQVAGTTAQTNADGGTEASAAQGEGQGAPAPTIVATLEAGGCLPEAFAIGTDGIPCTVVEILPASSSSSCSPELGLGAVDPNLAAAIRARTGAPTDAMCTIRQLAATANPKDFANGSCATAADSGWCYVTGEACPQAIVFSAGLPAPGATVLLACDL